LNDENVLRGKTIEPGPGMAGEAPEIAKKRIFIISSNGAAQHPEKLRKNTSLN
jgi:hypothetical protein